MGSVPRILLRCFEDQACQTTKHRTVVRSLVFVDRAGGAIQRKALRVSGGCFGCGRSCGWSGQPRRGLLGFGWRSAPGDTGLFGRDSARPLAPEDEGRYALSLLAMSRTKTRSCTTSWR